MYLGKWAVEQFDCDLSQWNLKGDIRLYNFHRKNLKAIKKK